MSDKFKYHRRPTLSASRWFAARPRRVANVTAVLLLAAISWSTCRTFCGTSKKPSTRLISRHAVANIDDIDAIRKELAERLGSQYLNNTRIWAVEDDEIRIRGGLKTYKSFGYVYALQLRYCEHPTSEPELKRWFKLGGTTNPQSRMSNIRTAHPLPPQQLLCEAVPDWRACERTMLEEFEPLPPSFDGGREWRWLEADDEECLRNLFSEFRKAWSTLDDEVVEHSAFSRAVAVLKSSTSDREKESMDWHRKASQYQEQELSEDVALMEAQPALGSSEIGDDVQRRIDPAVAKAEIQREAVEAMMQYFYEKKGTKATVILPGGSGKTVFGLRATEALTARKQTFIVLVLLPTLDLVSQTMREWTNFGDVKQKHRLAVCSKVADKGVEFTTDESQIAEFLDTNAGAPGIVAVFSTYQSSAKLTKALKKTKNITRFDLIICDEAHETAGRGNKMFARPLYDRFIPASRRLFMTATPRRFNVDLDDGLQVVASMDNETLYGPVVYRLKYKEAIQRGIVAPLKLFLVNATQAYQKIVAESPDLGVDLRKRAGKSSKKTSRHSFTTVDRDYTELAVALIDAHRRFNVSSVFSFHSNNNEAEKFQNVASDVFAAATEASNFKVDRVSGRMPPRKRRDKLDKVGQGVPMLITNARVLTTGVSVPEVDMVVLANRPRSEVSTLQAIARAARVSDGKDVGYVMVPFYAGRNAADEGAYDAVIDVIANFMLHDGDLGNDLLRALPRWRHDKLLRAEHWPKSLQQMVHQDYETSLPLHVIEQVIHTSVQKMQPSWDYRFSLLEQYVARQGHVKVPKDHRENGVLLGDWLSRQRQKGVKGGLPAGRLEQLKALGVQFLPRLQFDDYVEALRRFKNETGHIDVSYDFEEDGCNLGSWLNQRRTKAKNGKLADEQQRTLEELGIDLTPKADQWEAYYEVAKAFVAREGHADIGDDAVEEGRAVGRWLKGQRASFANRRMKKARRVAFESLGIELDKHQAKWNWWFRLLEGFKTQERHLDVPAAHEENGHKLGNWFYRQKVAAKKGELEAARQERLESLGADLSAK
eukprot:TRINITY_DN51451_c0_g1_i2.p1 TRINITY_DN51451_c0_g1~~TRINITY_DN51451_c0_g1_i2.p1  ORF type:complete len:1051 (+),score=219.08 TRINITY_DN51451_c0_g1_i2:95-3247(+)